MKSQLTTISPDIPKISGGYCKIISALFLANLLLMTPALSWAANKPPKAVATATPISGQAPFNTTLDASQSSDTDGSVVAYSWKFGDGTSSTNPTESHVYSTAGTYKVSLKVTDNLGATRTTSITITVEPPPPPQAATIPPGVYAVIGTAASTASSLLTNPDVEGIILRDVWSSIEAQPGVYNWSYLDNEIQKVTAAGKSVSLVINSGGQSIPSWVLDLNVQKFTYINSNSNQDTYNTEITIPVFWDPVYLQKKIDFIRAAGQRYGTNPNIVMVDAQCANASTADWNVPSTDADIAEWNALGFTSDKVLDACTQVIDAAMAAFPNKEVKMAIGRISSQLDSYFDPDYVAAHIIDYSNSTYPGRFLAARYNLSTTTPDPLSSSTLGAWQIIYDHKPNIGAQMLWFATDESSCRMNGNVSPCDAYTMLNTAVNTALNYGMEFLEIYQADIDNPNLSSIIHNAAVSLGTNN